MMVGLLKEIIYTPISLVKGLVVTFVNFWRRKVTLQYPDVRWELPDNYRGVPALPTNPQTGRDKCIACGACARICPQNAIEIVTETGEDKKRRLVGFTLDASVCSWCGLCTEVCPVHAIIMSKAYELASFDREGMKYGLDKLHQLGGEIAEESEEEKAKTAGGGGG